MTPIPMTITHPDLTPTRGTPGAAGLDLKSAENRMLMPGSRGLIRTTLAIAIPEGHMAWVTGRSGLALRKGLLVFPGVIDSDYRGEVGVIVQNLSTIAIRIGFGERIAQIVVMPFTPATLVPVTSLPETERGAGGFGSTGKD